MANDPAVSYNRATHDRNLPSYRRRHPEIYNETEQARLSESLRLGLQLTEPSRPLVLDFGTGAGNLADHFAVAGAEVSIADVSPLSVAAVGDRLNIPSSQRFVLDGQTLAGLPPAHFDLVAAYSVLHHIPDYLTVVRDLTGLLRPGGIIYLDHEAAPAYWEPDPVLREYRGRLAQVLQKHSRPRLLRLLSWRWWQTRWGTLQNPRFQIDGDLHVWPDDHIEWDRIASTLHEAGMEAVMTRDYLLCRGEGELAALHREYQERCSDMRLGIFRKR